jgi:putative ABC transport system permease protein
MLRLLRTLSWRHLQRHRLRTLLTFLGITLGVGVIVAIAVVNRSLTSSFQTTIEQIAGKAVLQVSNGESGVAESAFPLIRDTPGVQDAAAAVEGFLPVRGAERERLYIYGVDFLTDVAIRDHHFVSSKSDFDEALDFISQHDSIALTESFSRRLNLPPGSRITLTTSRGKQDYTVRSLLRPRPSAETWR